MCIRDRLTILIYLLVKVGKLCLLKSATQFYSGLDGEMCIRDSYNTLYKGDRVVVAGFAIHPTDSVDSVWVKLAHSQDVYKRQVSRKAADR